MALTDAGLDALRASLYQGLVDASAKADKVHEAMRTLQRGTMEYDRLHNDFYIHHGEVEGFSRALFLFDQARRSAKVTARELW
jgi:hypothetical protein